MVGQARPKVGQAHHKVGQASLRKYGELSLRKTKTLRQAQGDGDGGVISSDKD
ncbi:hypothetical protein [Pararhodonellum marinum]|uniref:hypothetical protein n=1 Tax=Pararhodonellum marinum TaxID=2755358 RepID=UPI00188FBA71|nr:hypothetical protein [Pararhodonellum marinum]